MLITKKL